jgi:hypothetical protein
MMKSNRIPILALAGMLPFCSLISLQADDWKTTDGKVYQDVKVISVSPDSVTILHQDGGASVPLATLPADLQKRFFYDPAKAQASAEEKAKDEAAAKQAARDRQLEATQLLTEEDGNASGQAAIDSSTPTGPVAAPANQSSTQDFADTLTGIPLMVPASPTHHTISEVTDSTQSTRHDLSDPTYHTMAHMQYMIRVQGLRPDPNDPNHHTMDEIGH